MGMSASQARLLSLQAQLSNLEYQGQQINQARTVLSQQATALYNSLLSMTVPTPPATTDFQTVKYTGTLGATEYSFDANSIKPDGDFYSITMQEKAHGDSLQKNTTIATVNRNAQGTFRGVPLDTSSITIKGDEPVPSGKYQMDSTGSGFMVQAEIITIEPEEEGGEPTYALKNPNGTYYTKSGTTYTPCDSTPTPTGPNDKFYFYSETSEGYAEGQYQQVSGVQTSAEEIPVDNVITADSIDRIYIINDDGTVRKADAGDFNKVDGYPNLYQLKSENIGKYLEQTENSGSLYQMEGDVANTTVGGKGVHELTEEEKQKYGDAIANSGLKDANGEPYGPEAFYMYYDDKDVAVFVLKSDVTDGNNNATTYSYVANGEYTKNTTYDDVQLTFDPTNGRITEIAIPTYDGEGNVASWTSIPVSAETVTDEAAYEDAYNKYEYDTYLYDQKNKEINAKTEVIQQEDKNLELKLQRLDNERTQITTEIEAVEKVINDNIESSYKTFSG